MNFQKSIEFRWDIVRFRFRLFVLISLSLSLVDYSIWELIEMLASIEWKLFASFRPRFMVAWSFLVMTIKQNGKFFSSFQIPNFFLDCKLLRNNEKKKNKFQKSSSVLGIFVLFDWILLFFFLCLMLNFWIVSFLQSSIKYGPMYSRE